MKKIFCLLPILITAMVISACGSKIPSGMTQQTYDNGCRALEIMEKYNDVEISAEEAETRLKSIQSSLESEYTTLMDTLESGNNLIVKLNVSFFITALHGTAGNTYSLEDDMRDILEK